MRKHSTAKLETNFNVKTQCGDLHSRSLTKRSRGGHLHDSIGGIRCLFVVVNIVQNANNSAKDKTHRNSFTHYI